MGALHHLITAILAAVLIYILCVSNSNRIPNYANIIAYDPPGIKDDFLVKPLDKAVKLFDGNIYLPEATVVSSTGQFYVSSGNGSILEIDPVKKVYRHVVHTGGRPLGMKFGKDGRLLVADALVGLLAVDLNTKSIEILCNYVEGRPVRFANSVTVTKDGTIYFSDSGDIAPMQQLDGNYGTHHSAVVQILVANPTGRLIKIDPVTKKASVVVKDMNFANGVALSSDESFLLVSDLGHNAIRRLWLEGPKKGKEEMVLSELPGFPDNIQQASDGGFWVALASPRSAMIDAAHPYPWLKSIILAIPMSIIPKPSPSAQVLKVSKDLKIQYKLLDETGHIPVVTDAMEHAGKLYLSAVNAHYWGFVDLKLLK